MRVWACGAAAWLAGVVLAAPASAGGFPGWQVMRVIKQDGQPQALRAADLDGDGRDELIVVNTRQSRLELYRWLVPDDREAPGAPDPERPNELPMAPEFERTEVPLERLPVDVLHGDADGDGAIELIVLELPPLRVVTYDRVRGEGDDGPRWERGRSWDLLEGSLAGRGRKMLFSPIDGDGREVLVSFDDGIQRLRLAEGERARWLAPREKKPRVDWWTVDLDGDDDLDLVEWARIEGESVRWYANSGGKLLPAQPLSDLAIDAMEAMPGPGRGGGELLLLGGLKEGVLRRHRMTSDAASPLGERRPLPVADGSVGKWCGYRLPDGEAMLVLDPNQPRVMLYRPTQAGWEDGGTFPIISDVQRIASPAASPGLLLLWAKDAGDLYESRWKEGRLTYPRPMELDVLDALGEAERRVLALESVGRRTWFAVTVDHDVYLFTFGPGRGEAEHHRFADVGDKVDRVVWMGERRLLVQDKYARSPKLVTLDAAGGTVVAEPPHLKKTKLDEYALIESPTGDLLPARLADGVLQWLDHELQPRDQVMLPDGLRLVSFIVGDPAPDALVAWALEAGGRKVHLLKPDDAGVMRVAESYEASGGVGLVRDGVVGKVLVDRDRLVALGEGRPNSLELVDSVDGRVGRPSGVKEATIHRVFTTDITGDGADEIVLSDDRRHQLTVLRPDDDETETLMSWPVFEDLAYPYGGGGENELVQEPRIVVGADLDGDDHRDLAMLCYDRLLIYLGRSEAETEGEQ